MELVRYGGAQFVKFLQVLYTPYSFPNNANDHPPLTESDLEKFL